jgi:hypothetical protein
VFEGDRHLEALQALFEAPIPVSVREWLINGTPEVIGGLPLLGLPIGPDLGNAWGATQYLRTCRPELPTRFLVIRLLGERALCVDIAGENEDSPLTQVDCGSFSAPKMLNLSFEAYLQDAATNDEMAHRIFDRVDELLTLLNQRGYTYDHVKGGKLPRAHQWRIVRSCVHDRLVGIAALRQNDRTEATEIDLFEVADHPLYAAGHGVRSLLMLVFADAYKAGSSMRLIFNNVPGIRRASIPREIIEFAKRAGVSIARQRNDQIDHETGSAIFAAAAGLSPRTISIVQSSTNLSLDSISYLAATRIWTLEEIAWLLDECPNAETVLFGLHDAQDWLAYTGAIGWARAAVLATAFRSALNEEGEEGIDAASIRVGGGHFEFRLARETVAPWTDGTKLKPGDWIAVLPRPRIPLSREPSLLLDDAKGFANKAGRATHRFILQSTESAAADVENAKPSLDELGVTRIFSPHTLPDLDNLVEAKFLRAKRVRR